MAFTDNSDLYGAILESGVNRVVRHVMRQRPSLFHYATERVLKRPSLLCAEISPHPVVIERGNPLINVQPPLPVIGTMYGLDYCVQLTDFEVEFHPGNVFALPAELAPPLAEQRFALHGKACAGLGCPSQDLVKKLPPAPIEVGRRGDFPQQVRYVIPTEQLTCFCLELFAVGDFDVVGFPGAQRLEGTLDGLEIVDLGPEGLENSIECYASLVVQLVLLPSLSEALDPLQFTQALMGQASITLRPSVTSAGIPNNPAIEEDQVKVFLDMQIESGAPTPCPPCVPTPDTPDGPSGPGPVPGVVRPRVRTGPADMTAAIGENAVRALVNAVVDNFCFCQAGGDSDGVLTYSYTAAAHLEGGSIELNEDTIRIDELDVKWDTLELCLGINIDEQCIPIPFFDDICIFSDNPDIEFCLNIGGFITSEISATVRPLTKYAVNPARTAGMNDWDAHDAGIPNKWQVILDPLLVDFDLIDVADTVGDLLDAAIDAAVDGLLGPLPGFVKDFIKSVLGSVVDLVRGLLDLGDDLTEWLSQLLGVSLDLFGFLIVAFKDFLGLTSPLMEIPDPLPVLPADGSLIPVMIPIEFLGISVNDDEMIALVDIGA